MNQSVSECVIQPVSEHDREWRQTWVAGSGQEGSDKEDGVYIIQVHESVSTKRQFRAWPRV